MTALEDISIFDLSRDNEDVGAEADMNNLDTTIQVSPIPTTRIHKDHPLNQVIRDLQSATQTRNMSKKFRGGQGLVLDSNLQYFKTWNQSTKIRPVVIQKIRFMILEAFTNSDYARASLDRKSTTGEKAKKSVRLIMEKLVIRENRQRVLVRKRIKRVVNAGDSKLMLLGITYCCWFSKTTAWNEFSRTMASVIICLATNQKFNFSKYIFESMVKNLDNVGKFLMYLSGEDSLKLNELMELWSNLQTRVLNLETTKTTQANEIASLKRRVKKLEKKNQSRTHKLKRLYKVGLSTRVESSGDEEIRVRMHLNMGGGLLILMMMKTLPWLMIKLTLMQEEVM
ncbi:hypothetical protein Tco_0007026 [Tanacetum coccineum]